MIIKEIDKNNLKDAVNLYCECFNKEKTLIDVELNEDESIVGIYLEENLIGLVQLSYINNIFENKKICHINSFCIKKEYRHQGYGDTLLKECLRIAKDNNVDIVNMTSNKNRVYAHMLYQKNNFEVVDTIFLKKDI